MKKSVCLTIMVLIVLLLPGTVFAQIDLSAEAAIAIDAQTGQVLYSKNPDTKLPPASTTKVLTAVVAMEKGRLDEMLSVSQDATEVEGSSIFLEAGDKVSLRDLLYGLLMESGNDAAEVIAAHVGGSREKFIQMMNQKAEEVGMQNSHFTNPHGLPDPNHYSTARDLALITRYAMRYPLFKEIVATKQSVISLRNFPQGKTLTNHNKLLWEYEGADGVKTGYTDAAGNCLIGSASRNGRQIITVVLGSEGSSMYDDTVKLLDYGFENYENLVVMPQGTEIAPLQVRYGEETKAVTASDFIYTVPKGYQPQISTEYTLKPVSAPLAPDTVVGEIIFKDHGEEVGKVSLVPASAVKRKWWASLLGILLFFVLIFCVFFLYEGWRRKRLRQRRLAEWRRRRW